VLRADGSTSGLRVWTERPQSRHVLNVAVPDLQAGHRGPPNSCQHANRGQGLTVMSMTILLLRMH
jgi:hypothetical protein